MDSDQRFRNLLTVYHQSYLWEIGVEVKHSHELVQLVKDIRRKRGPDFKKTDDGRIRHTKEYLYLDYISDAIEKLGFLYFSRDQMKKHYNNLHVCKFHVYSSIFHCKALLDTVAGLLNHHYELQKHGSRIDFNHRKFLSDLGKKDAILSQKIKNFNVWISKLSKWRNALIHRHGTPLFPVGKNRFLMPVEPKTLSEAMLLPGRSVAPLDFCEENIKCVQLVLEIVFEHIINDLESITNP